MRHSEFTNTRIKFILASCVFGLLLAAVDCASLLAQNTDGTQSTDKPSAHFDVTVQTRSADNAAEIRTKQESWPAAKTAVIVCDMWDSHHCFNAVGRVGEIAPRMNAVVEKARDSGATIIHAPSGCVNSYADHAARKNVASVPKAKSIPEQIEKWCYQIDPEKAGVYPLDQTDGGEDDDPQEHAAWAAKLESLGLNPKSPWKRQVDAIRIKDEDFITDNGIETWNILESRGIDNVIMVGVHTNMCVLGRPFGLRQLSKNGKNIVLMRDMTDAMYNPASWPYVDHFQGTDLIVQHIEKYVCPTITSDQLLGGEPFRFKDDKPKHAVLLISETLYDTKATLPPFAEQVLANQLGFETTVLHADEKSGFGDLTALSNADLLILSIRRKALPTAELNAIRSYLKAGKPLVAIRTVSHAFDTRGEHSPEQSEWPAFDNEILGIDYTNHFPNEMGGPAVTFSNPDHPHEVATGLVPFKSEGSLYKSTIVNDATIPILTGTLEGAEPQVVAVVTQLGEDYKHGRVFYTSLGNQSDFTNPQFLRLMENGIRWTTGMKIGNRPDSIDVTE